MWPRFDESLTFTDHLDPLRAQSEMQSLLTMTILLPISKCVNYNRNNALLQNVLMNLPQNVTKQSV